MKRLTFDGKFCGIAQCMETPGGSFCENGTCSQKEVWLRLKAYEDTGLTPEQCAEYGKADREGRYIVLRDAEKEGVKRLRELAKADKEGRVAVLPCAVGGSMLDMSDIEHPEIMKRLHFAVAYDSSRGNIFYQPYDIFRANFDAAYIQPLSKEAAAMLKEVQNDTD